MSEVSEAIEKAQEGERAEFFNKRIALVIAILALFLSFSETLGKGAQNEATNLNIKASDLYAFFQARTIRMTTLTTAAEEMTVAAQSASDPAKDAMQKQIDAWKKTAARYDSDPQSHEGRKELLEHAKDAEEERDSATAKYHHYELASAAFQIGIVLASAAVITGMVVLVWLGGLLGAIGVVLLALGLWAPHAVPFIATL
jgi:small-conductance mechanosensitive channel